jgi:DNA-directed RNA polymerase specialized sigma24 family protein
MNTDLSARVLASLTDDDAEAHALHARLRRLVPDCHYGPDDAIQDTWIWLHGRREPEDPIESAPAFLTTVARNIASDRQRRRNHRRMTNN